LPLGGFLNHTADNLAGQQLLDEVPEVENELRESQSACNNFEF
jgi:hypothetical protein